jgi:hypothetical protein
MDTVRLGLVGLGWFGAVLAESARASGAAEVVSCFARSADARAAFAEEHGCRAVGDLETMLDDPEVGGVIVATPQLDARRDRGRRGGGRQARLRGEAAHAHGPRREARRRVGGAVRRGRPGRAQPAQAARQPPDQVDDRRRRARDHPPARGDAHGGRRAQARPPRMAEGPGRVPVWRHDRPRCPHGRHVPLLRRAREARDGLQHADTRLQRPGRGDDRDPRVRVGADRLDQHKLLRPPVVSLSVFGSDGAAWNEEDGTRLYTQPRSDPTRSEHQVETIDTVLDEIVEFARAISGEGRPETGMAEAIEVAAVLEAIGRSLETGCSVDVSELR